MHSRKPTQPNEHLNKGYRTAVIKALAQASHKTYTYISLKQRDNSRNYGLFCNLGKQMAETKGLFDIVPEPPYIDIYDFY